MLKVHHPENKRFVTFQFNMLCSTMLLIAIEYSFTARFRTKYGLVLPKLLSLLTWQHNCPRISLVAITHTSSEIEQKAYLR